MPDVYNAIESYVSAYPHSTASDVATGLKEDFDIIHDAMAVLEANEKIVPTGCNLIQIGPECAVLLARYKANVVVQK